MCKELVLTWQSPSNREWFVVGRLKQEQNAYKFVYTRGAEKAEVHGFIGFSGMSKFDQKYQSDTLFPLFQNRVLNKSRPDRGDFLEWLDMTEENYSEFEELARTGGIRVTDNVQLYPVPENRDGFYEVLFFTHGTRHLAPHFLDRVDRLSKGEKLYLAFDRQNERDNDAILLRTKDPVEFVGYCPKFFAKDFVEILNKSNPLDDIVTVEKVNSYAPEQLKLLCKFRALWPENFIPFNHDDFCPLI
ncbi:HIRAN domain-containing protein [Hydrogenovibrio sp. JE_KL2]|uniref:HIRAN domain-containing protein n=1 Tax=Hydrogenovibrio sp. JE_KL2 TaxID=2651188 RepID=UPI00128D4B5F|nr:HIRAN domain-containing protein [Hydrogenovibrio sp. JE_KL2]MPQ76317.1 hypothetical protein [Hydrogenovibrio sp. JE_KL2]